MRTITISLCALAFVTAPAIAREGNPIAGVGVSVESSPGNIVTMFNNVTEARTACTTAHGSFTTPRGRNVCTNPRTRLRSTFVPTTATRTAPAH